VLILENRSFDHMLGYLKLEGGRAEVEGLTPGMSNTLSFDFNGTPRGTAFPVHHLESTIFEVDPGHNQPQTATQINAGRRDMSGFVDDFAKVMQARGERFSPGQISCA